MKVNQYATMVPYNSYKLNAQPKYNINQSFKSKYNGIA
jgi:hypothetical protein